MTTKHNEISILKSVCTKLDEETVALVCMFYHIKDHDVENDKSFYWYETRVEKISDLKNHIEDLNKPENRCNKFKWNNKSWNSDWVIYAKNLETNAQGAKFLKHKLNKALDFNDYVNQVKYGIRKLANGKLKENVKTKYETENYVDSNGNVGLSIVDYDTLKNHIGIPMRFEIKMKRENKNF